MKRNFSTTVEVSRRSLSEKRARTPCRNILMGGLNLEEEGENNFKELKQNKINF